MRSTITTVLDSPADTVWELVKKSSTLVYVTRGMTGFSGAESFPEEWQEGSTVHTRVLFFGMLPGWQHQLTFVRVSDQDRELYTNEKGGILSSWNHRISVTALDPASCRYTDEIDIEAGLLTPLVWAYSHLFYRYRQWRWVSLLKQGGA